MTTQVIVVGFDGSPDSRAALGWAARAAKCAGARLRIVHAVGLLEHAGMTLPAVHRDVGTEAAMEAGLNTNDLEWCVVDGDPCTALLRMSEPPDATLLVVGSRGAGAHSGTLLGSTSLELAQHAKVPVTIVPGA